MKMEFDLNSGNSGPEWVDREGMLRLRRWAAFEKGPGRTGIHANWGKGPLAHFDIERNSLEDLKKTGLALYRLFEAQARPSCSYHVRMNRQRGVGPNDFPDYDTSIRMIVEALHQIALQDATMTGGRPVRFELVDENGDVVFFVE